MYTFYIISSEIKDFMNKLFKDDVFDFFEVRNVELETFVKYEIKGNLNNDFFEYNKEYKRFFCNWKELKPYVFQLIKGNKKPKNMKFVFSFPQNEIDNLSENASALFLNLSFENNTVICTTGTSQKNFSLDRNLDIIWEKYIKDFFNKIQVAIEERK